MSVRRRAIDAARRAWVAGWLRLGPVEPDGGIVSRCTTPPVFVGGTGRSGTTITGRIIGSHPASHMIPYEVRFLTDQGGLCDLVVGTTSFAGFAWRTQHTWVVTKAGERRLVPQPRMRAALRELQRGLRGDRHAAAARFVERVLDPLAREQGADGWVEMTPNNILVADALLRMWPDARIVHTIRDGRDTACSVVTRSWGPDNLDEALRWWARKLERAFRATEGAPAASVLVIQMEELLGTDREAQLARLVAFLGLPDVPEIHDYFDEWATTSRAKIGRWRDNVPADELPAFEALYRRLADDIVARGIPYREIRTEVQG